MLCGKLLKPVLGLYLDSLGRREDIPVAVYAEVLGMSAATIDRRLRGAKARSGGGGRRRHDSLTEHRRSVPLKVHTWPDLYPKDPGWIEADTVAHCGGSMSGSFIWTLTLTDVATGWTRLESVWNKGAEGVCQAISTFLCEAPFRVVAFNSDNGNEFFNGHLHRAFAPLAGRILRTRSRSWNKNDNAHVEQKNGVLVRGLFGYTRLDNPDLIPLMQRIDRDWCLIKNLFTPTMRLLSKERLGANYRKRFEPLPKTPAQRLLESPNLSAANKQCIRSLLANHDIVDLKTRLDANLKRMARQINGYPEASGNTLQPRDTPSRLAHLSVSSHLRQPEPLAACSP